MAATVTVLALRQAATPPPRPASPSPPPAPAPVVSTPPAPAAAPRPAAADTERWNAIAAENDALRAANREMAADNERLRRQLDDLLRWILENFQGRYPVPERMVGRLDLPAVTDDFRVHDDLAELLRLTPQERARLDDAFRSARAMAEAAELAVMRPSMPSPRELVIEIPPHIEQGREIRERLIAAIEAALGPHRASWATAAADRDLDRRFHGFGADHRTIRLELVYRDDHDQPWIRITDERASVLGEGQVQRLSREITATTLPAEYTPYLERLPAD
ncbi:MAG: hypothetical protein N2652_06865 [Kiritimatiellae bacterium]|nr:hypothetical protein [Kiritimatiellia bacterium]